MLSELWATIWTLVMANNSKKHGQSLVELYTLPQPMTVVMKGQDFSKLLQKSGRPIIGLI